MNADELFDGQDLPQNLQQGVSRVRLGQEVFHAEAGGLGDLPRLRPDGGEHPAEIEAARLNQVGRLLRVEEEKLVPLQSREIPAELRGILRDALRAFLEGHENAGLVVQTRAVHQRFQRHERLARAGTSLEQRRAPARQPAVGDFIKTLNAGAGFQWSR